MMPNLEVRESNDAVFAAARDMGLGAVSARVVATRFSAPPPCLKSALYPDLTALEDPHGLHDMDRAAKRVADAIEADERIGLCVDHDADGTTAGAVLYSAFTEKFGVSGERLRFYISHRRLQGYGLNASLADEILADATRPTLLITADCGSSDEAQIARLLPHTATIITDHHEIPKVSENGVERVAPPTSAYAVISAIHPESTYDRNIAGCMTAWLLMAAVRRELVARGRLPADAPHLQDELAFVAIGSQADCVSLASPINRAVIRYGLARMNRDDTPCWRVAREMLLKDGERFTSDFLGFQLAPRISAPGRLDKSHPGLEFLLAVDEDDARRALQVLTEANEARKAVQAELAAKALPVATAQVDQGKRSIAVFLPDGHVGVHGIVASRLVELYGRPAVMMAPRDGDDSVAGCSFRSVPGLHIRDALDWLNQKYPGMLLGYGGHAMAAGASVAVENIEQFMDAFEEAVQRSLSLEDVGPVVLVDIHCDASELTLDALDELMGLEPFGEKFPSASLSLEGVLRWTRWVGQDSQHLQFGLQGANGVVKGIWFFAKDRLDAPADKLDGRRVRVVCQPAENWWQGRRSLQIFARWFDFDDEVA